MFKRRKCSIALSTDIKSACDGTYLNLLTVLPHRKEIVQYLFNVLDAFVGYRLCTIDFLDAYSTRSSLTSISQGTVLSPILVLIVVNTMHLILLNPIVREVLRQRQCQTATTNKRNKTHI